MNAERTAAELADAAFETPDPGFGARLAAIRASAADDGVSVVVDLHGALVDLRFDRRALNRSPRELAGVIRLLASEAGADALREGREVLGDLLPDPPPAPRSRRQPEPEDDAFTPVTWAT
ncbi:hypothetical protein [Amycolatopsis sp. NPDC051061]|uniref:hypothetical protein n=1 Tax=Amycolatopsis sp. NPDC051061 TaxID=3155042 RepID=UPI00341719F3